MALKRGRDLTPVSNRRIPSMIDAGLEIRWIRIELRKNTKDNCRASCLSVRGTRCPTTGSPDVTDTEADDGW